MHCQPYADIQQLTNQPQLTYLAQCPGDTCTGVNANTLKWFKIDEAGLLSGTVYSGSWADGQMIAQNSSWTTTIPSSVPSGNYLIRFETIALHSLPAQLYPECAQITITGGGSRQPTADELVSFPGAYSANDPGCALSPLHSYLPIQQRAQLSEISPDSRSVLHADLKASKTWSDPRSRFVLLTAPRQVTFMIALCTS